MTNATSINKNVNTVSHMQMFYGRLGPLVQFGWQVTFETTSAMSSLSPTDSLPIKYHNNVADNTNGQHWNLVKDKSISAKGGPALTTIPIMAVVIDQHPSTPYFWFCCYLSSQNPLSIPSLPCFPLVKNGCSLYHTISDASCG